MANASGITLQSGSGPYNDQNEIYHPGHQVYSSNLVNGIPQGISGAILNIDLLDSYDGKDFVEEKVAQTENGAIQKKTNTLTGDKVVKPNFNAYAPSITTNQFKITLDGDTETKGTFVNL